MKPALEQNGSNRLIASLPRKDTRRRAVYDVLLKLAQERKDINHASIAAQMHIHISTLYTTIGQMVATGVIIREKTENGPCLRVGGLLTGVVLDGRAGEIAQNELLTEQVYALLCNAAEQGEQTPHFSTMSEACGVKQEKIRQTINKLMNFEKIERLDRGSRFRVRITATGKETLRPVWDGNNGVRRTSLDYRTVADSMPRVHQDVCWYCGQPSNRGAHARCGVAGRVMIIPRPVAGAGL